MANQDVEYHLRRAAQHRKQAENCPADIVYFHTKLAGLHEQRASDLASGTLPKDDQLFVVKH